jgi:hypothetical protein
MVEAAMVVAEAVVFTAVVVVVVTTVVLAVAERITAHPAGQAAATIAEITTAARPTRTVPRLRTLTATAVATAPGIGIQLLPTMEIAIRTA